MAHIVSTIAELRSAIAALKHTSVGRARIGMVPTMGALHDGHVSLVTEAKAHCDHVVVSIFVNPAQFAPHEDFDAYPRTLDADLARLGDAAAIVFAPNAREMYPEGFATGITVGGPSAGLETDFRPHFFTGVATVVAKLLIAALPDIAVFGEKDYQQLQVVTRLVRDLALPTRIIGAPTLREADGLAMSSRNAYLSADERKVAATLNVILKNAILQARRGDLRAAEMAAESALTTAGFDSVDYVAIRDAESLSVIAALERPARILAAAKIGKTRLIDNMAV
ncbi:MAG: Pantothenate synthetase [Alphaproteobacteria bacterium]|nr:Pantothenate synthetase [Alphaproteobacteria bacterium]